MSAQAMMFDDVAPMVSAPAGSMMVRDVVNAGGSPADILRAAGAGALSDAQLLSVVEGTTVRDAMDCLARAGVAAVLRYGGQ